ncbi:hypothetical protein [Oceanobacillus manasiensis]|uniref:hypothetical protein n=1 Tax=Oceanobacillus manasiensis TaxID=586413 RepID=UPI0005A72EBC|nr:hypothetical protein [Oceanobacillus manasiensis]
MSSERIIYEADLGRIENGLKVLEDGVEVLENGLDNVYNQIDTVNREVLDSKASLNALIEEFHLFVRKDQLEKNIQIAETRLVKVRQELETKFGHYGEVRRRVTGILQAADVGLVKKGTIENTTEEQMLLAPRYWLAPCLIALSAWLNDNHELADKAMMEALRRDDEKTSLFFALVTRRGARYKASRAWLERYFGLQDPHQLEREIVVLIDGFTNGIFGADSRAKISKEIETWINELSERVGFVEEQHEQWKIALKSKQQKLNANDYTYLRKNSTSWPKLQESLEGAKLYQIIFDYFSEIFSKEITPNKGIAYAVDALLDTLVSKFDEEELPNRRDERLLSLIIENDGDKVAAQQLFDDEKTLEERVSFNQLLTNFAMHADVSNASLATQKYSISLSKNWIKSAYDDLTVKNRAIVPVDIDLEIDQWKGTTQDGSNEDELIQSLDYHIETRRKDALSQVKLKLKYWIGLAGGLMFAYLGFSTPFLFVFALICAGYFYIGKKDVAKRKDHIRKDYNNLLKYCREELLASLVEVVDWREEYKKEDENSVKFTEFLDSISPEQYTFSSHDVARSVVN